MPILVIITESWSLNKKLLLGLITKFEILKSVYMYISFVVSGTELYSTILKS